MGFRIDSKLVADPVVQPTGSGTLAIHTATPTHFNPAQEFINVSVLAAVSAQPNKDLKLELASDTNLPSIIPSGVTSLRFNHSWGSFTKENPVFGRYVIRHNLNPAIYPLTITHATVIDDTVPGRIVIDILNQTAWRIDFPVSEGPMPSSWFIETIKMANEAAYDNIALPIHHPSRVFVPEFLGDIERFKPRTMRFMKAMATESSKITDVYPYAGVYNLKFGAANCYPLDVMVSLCNAYDIAPYFNLGANASDALTDEFATYVRDNLKPSLTVYAGFFNEYWNTVYQAIGYIYGEGIRRLGVKGPGVISIDKANRRITSSTVDLTTLFSAAQPRFTIGKFAIPIDVDGNVSKGIPSATATTAYFLNSVDDDYVEEATDAEYWYNPGNNLYPNEGYTILATKHMKRWKTIFDAVGQQKRLVCTWETQMAGTNRLSSMTKAASYWGEDADYIDPLTVFDGVALNPYFGGGIFKKAGAASGAWQDNPFTAFVRPFAESGNVAAFSRALRDYMLDVPIPGVALSKRSIAGFIERKAKEWRGLLKPYGLRLLAYEGSAHIIHSVLDETKRPSDADIVTAYRAFLQTDEATEVFRAWAEAHVRWFDGPVMQFNFAQPISTTGAYGLVEFFGGPSDKRQELLLTEYSNRAPWWVSDNAPQAVPVPDQIWTAGVDPGFTLDDWVSNNATVFSGMPPAGMLLDGGTGALTGVPLAGSGIYNFTASNYAGSVEVMINIIVV